VLDFTLASVAGSGSAPIFHVYSLYRVAWRAKGRLHRRAAACVAQSASPVYDAASDPADLAPAPGRAAAWAGLGLHQLRYVLAAAEHGGFRRAARSLGVQQSAVSRRIQDLEARLGSPIFARGPQGVRLTEAGLDFVRLATGAMLQLDQAVDGAAEVARGEAGVLRVGVLASFGGEKLEAVLGGLLARVTELQIDLMEASAEALTEALRQGQLDVAFLLDAPADLASQPAWRERLMLALPVDHGLAARATLGRRELGGLAPRASRALMSGLLALPAGGQDLVGRLCVQDASPYSLVRLTALGQGCVLVTEGAAPRVTGVVYRPVRRARLSFRAVLGRRPEKPCVRRLLALLPADA